MSFRFWKNLWLPAVLLLGGGISIHAQEPPPRRSQPILFSEPKHDTVSSNLNLIVTKQAPLRNLEDDLKKPFELFGGANSLSGAPVVPQRLLPPPTLSNKRVRELLEKREEWLFDSSQNQDGAQTTDDLFKFPGLDLGEDNRKKTSLERYYDRLAQSRLANTNNQVRNSEPFNLQQDRELGEALSLQNSGNPLTDNQVIQQLLKQVGKPNNQGLFGADEADRRAGQLFELGKVQSATQQIQAQEARQEKFRAILEARTPTVSGVGAALKPFGDTTSPGFTAASTLAGTPTTSSSFSSDANANPNFVGKPAGPQELPRSAPALPSLTPAPPEDSHMKPEKPRPVSTFSLPRRTF